MTITALPIAAEAARQAAIKSVSKEVNIPGFRKGKAPEALILQKFPSQIDREMREIIVHNSFNEAMNLSSLRPYSNQAPLKLLKCEPADSSYLISIEFESYPNVPNVDPSSLTLTPIEETPVTEAEMDQKIEELRIHHAEWEEIAERQAESGDYVILDIDLIEGEPQKIRQDVRFKLEAGKFPSWALKLTQGLRAGESAEGSTEPEPSESSENFQPRKMRITLKKIQKAILPPIDDELAKKAGTSNLEDLRNSIQRSLQRNAENASLQEKRERMRKTLLDNYPFDLPAERLKELREECFQIAEEEKQGDRSYANQLFSNAEENLRLSYLLPKIIREHRLPVPDLNEVQKRVTEHMIMHYMAGHTEKLEEEAVQQLYQLAESQLLKERALDFLIQNAKIYRNNLKNGEFGKEAP
jgi:trigger factor